MTDMIKIAYELGQMQALADIGLIKDAGLMDKVREGFSRLTGMFRKKPITDYFSSEEVAKINAIYKDPVRTERVYKRLLPMSPSERAREIRSYNGTAGKYEGDGWGSLIANNPRAREILNPKPPSGSSWNT